MRNYKCILWFVYIFSSEECSQNVINVFLGLNTFISSEECSQNDSEKL